MAKTMNHSSDIWYTLFEQTPPILRYIIGILTLGLFTLASYIWRRQYEKLQAMEIQQTALATRSELRELHSKVDSVSQDVRKANDKVDRILLHLAIRD